MNGRDISADPELGKHAAWVQEFLPHYGKITRDNVGHILQEETARVFVRVLEDSGVFKRTPEGRDAFHRFVASFA